jgi:hypothetical protein
MKVTFLLTDENNEQHFTVVLNAEEADKLRKVKEAHDIDSKSAALKYAIESGMDY